MIVDGKLIKALRRKAGIRREELAAEADVSLSLIQKIELGEWNVRLENLIAVANVIDRRLPGARRKILESITDERYRMVVSSLGLISTNPITIKKRTAEERLRIAISLLEGVMKELSAE